MDVLKYMRKVKTARFNYVKFNVRLVENFLGVLSITYDKSTIENLINVDFKCKMHAKNLPVTKIKLNFPT